MLAAPSLGKRPVKVPILKLLRLFSPFAWTGERDFYQNAVESRLWSSYILSAGVYVCTFLSVAVKMSRPSLPLLLLLVCVTTTRGAATSDTPITCKAGDCTAGTRTSVTCYFNEDISVSRQAFSVDLYPFNASKDDIGEYRSCTEKLLSQTRRCQYVRSRTTRR